MKVDSTDELKAVIKSAGQVGPIPEMLLLKLDRYVEQRVLAELERLPFTDRETGCMDCIATKIVSDRVAELEEHNA